MISVRSGSQVNKSSGLGAAGADVDALLESFRQAHGVRVELSAEQRAALASLAGSQAGDTDRVLAYLGLAAAGVALIPGADKLSQGRLDTVLDAAVQIWHGRNLGKAIQGDTPVQRMRGLADALISQSNKAGAGAALGSGLVRQAVLADARLTARDVFAREAPAVRGDAVVAAQNLVETTRAQEGVSDPNTVESIFNHPPPQSRVTRAQAEAEGHNYFDTIPGTEEEWNAAVLARRFHDWIESRFKVGDHKQDFVELTHALSLEDRTKIAEAYAELRAAKRDRAFLDARGEPIRGRTAIDALHKKLVRAADSSPFGETTEAMLLKAQFHPDNVSGQPQAHDVVMLDLKGLFSKNGEAIQRLLMGITPAQVRALDQALQRYYDITLEKALGKLKGLDQRRALFLMNAPRVAGQVPHAYVQAFELREAVRGFGTDRERLFRALQGLTPSEAVAVAKAYKALNDKVWREPIDGDDGSGQSLRSSALYHRLFRDMNDVGVDTLWLERLAMAVEGLRFSRELEPADMEPVVRARAARYAALTLQLARKGKTDANDVVSVLSLIQSDVAVELDGRPSPAEVKEAFARAFAGESLGDLGDRVGGEVGELARIVLSGKGMDSPEAGAIRLRAALHNGPLGLGGAREEVVYAVLGRPGLEERDRLEYLRELREAYGKRYANGDVTALRRDLGKKLGEKLALPGGQAIASRALTLEEHGILTPAEQLAYALHEKGAFGVFGKTDHAAIVTTLSRISPLEKVVAMAEYARMVNRRFDLHSGTNPLLDDLGKRRGKDLKRITELCKLLPEDAEKLGEHIALYLNVPVEAAASTWLRQRIGGDVSEWLTRNFGDASAAPGAQRFGIEQLRTQVQAAGGARPFAELFASKVGLSYDNLSTTVTEMVRSARGQGLGKMLMDTFGPEGRALEAYARKVGAAIREAHLALERGQIKQEHLDQVRKHYAELLARLSQYDRLKDQRVEMVSNVALGIAIAGTLVAIPAVSPLLLAGIGAGAKGGLHFAAGERDATRLLIHLTRGGLAGALAGLVPMGVQLPGSAEVWLAGLHKAAAVTVEGGLQGGVVGAVSSAYNAATENDTWLGGTRAGLGIMGRVAAKNFALTAGLAAGGQLANYYAGPHIWGDDGLWNRLFKREDHEAVPIRRPPGSQNPNNGAPQPHAGDTGGSQTGGPVQPPRPPSGDPGVSDPTPQPPSGGSTFKPGNPVVGKEGAGQVFEAPRPEVLQPNGPAGSETAFGQGASGNLPGTNVRTADGAPPPPSGGGTTRLLEPGTVSPTPGSGSTPPPAEIPPTPNLRGTPVADVGNLPPPTPAVAPSAPASPSVPAPVPAPQTQAPAPATGGAQPASTPSVLDPYGSGGAAASGSTSTPVSAGARGMPPTGQGSEVAGTAAQGATRFAEPTNLRGFQVQVGQPGPGVTTFEVRNPAVFQGAPASTTPELVRAATPQSIGNLAVGEPGSVLVNRQVLARSTAPFLR